MLGLLDTQSRGSFTFRAVDSWMNLVANSVLSLLVLAALLLAYLSPPPSPALLSLGLTSLVSVSTSLESFLRSLSR